MCIPSANSPKRILMSLEQSYGSFAKASRTPTTLTLVEINKMVSLAIKGEKGAKLLLPEEKATLLGVLGAIEDDLTNELPGRRPSIVEAKNIGKVVAAIDRFQDKYKATPLDITQYPDFNEDMESARSAATEFFETQGESELYPHTRSLGGC